MSEVMDKLLETYPVYKDVNREALVDAIGKKYPVYLEHADFKEEFDALQALNKSVQETEPAVVPEPTVPATQAFDQLFSKPVPAATGAIPETTASPLVQSALEKTGADQSPMQLFKGAVSQDVQTLKAIQDKPLIELPKPTVNPDDSDHVKFMKGLAGSLASGAEGLLTIRSAELVGAGAVMGPLAPYFFGALGVAGAVKGGYEYSQAQTPQERGAATGNVILNLGMAELARRSGKGVPTPNLDRWLAPKTVEAAKAVTGMAPSPEIMPTEASAQAAINEYLGNAEKWADPAAIAKLQAALDVQAAIKKAKSVIKEGAPNAEQVSSTAPLHGDVLNEGRPKESAGQVPAVERGNGIQTSGQGKEVLEVAPSEKARPLTPLDRRIQDAEAGLWSLQGLDKGFLDLMRKKAADMGWTAEQYATQLEDALGKLTSIEATQVPAETKQLPLPVSSKEVASFRKRGETETLMEYAKAKKAYENKPLAPYEQSVEEIEQLNARNREIVNEPFIDREGSRYKQAKFNLTRGEAQLAYQKANPRPGPGVVGMGAATPGEFPTAPSPVKEALESAVSPLQKVRRTISRLWQTGEVKDAMTYTKDAGDNAASIFAKQTVNDIRKPFEREFGKESSKAEEALTFAREAGLDENVLRADRDKVASSDIASSKWGRKAIDAMDYALYHLNELKVAAQRFGEIADAQQVAEEAAGIPTLRRENYVPHVQDVEAPETFLSSAGGTGEGKPFTKVRTFDKLADSIAAGVDPVTINAVDLLEHRLRQGQRLINNRAWNESLKGLVDSKTKRPVGVAPTVVKRADGSTYNQAPSGYELQYLGGQPIAIQNGYEGIFSALTDPSYFRKSVAGRSFLQATGAGKSISLMLDTFHLGRIAFWESLIKSLGVETFKAPFPSYKKGLTLLDYSTEQIREMGSKGEIPKQWVDTLVEDKRNLTGLVDHGYNLGRISDALFQDVIHHIPGFGKFNKWLFEQFQRGAMNEIGLLETQRLRNARPEMSDAEVWRQTAKDLNTRFGNLGRQGVLKSRSGQDLASMLFLAPQWNEGLIRSEIGAITQTGKAIKDIAQGEKVYGGVLMRSVGAMAVMQFLANQLINLYTRGTPTWENPEEGFGAKVSAWIPDKIGGGPGFFLHPLGLAAETTHLITSKFEKTGDMAKTLNQYMRSRSSTSMRPVVTFITNEDFLGRKLKPGTVWGEMVKSAIPVPIGGSAVTAAAKEIATGQPSEQFPGQFQKQVMASVGVKTDQAPSPEQRIRDLAKDFNSKKGIEPSAEFYAGDYQALTQALRIGNKNDAAKAIDELLKKKTASQIVAHYLSWANHPFTGQRARENQFRQTLTAEQKTQYDAAVTERRRIGSAAREMVRTIKKP